ncbi:MAG: porin family protein [Planctomycetaceae bacterium]|jgi:hypothetical protein|nr:porin family protein [Planctomycetaceae bacterium]
MPTFPKKDHPSTIPALAWVLAFWCVLFVFGLFASAAFADGFGLANPAEKDFSERLSDTRNPGHLAKKTPVFNDRSQPAPQKTKTIRQVAASESDPFPQVSPSSALPAQSFDWGTVAPMMSGNSLAAHPNIIPYDPNAFAGGYIPLDPTMSNMVPNMYPAEMGIGYYSQFAQNPQQYPQGYMMSGENPYMNPYAPMYPQMGYPMGVPADYQAVPDYSSLYYAMMLQETQRQRAEESKDKPKKEKKEKDADDAKKQADANWSLNNLVPVRVTSPLCDTMLTCAKTISPFCPPPGPDKGVGMPLVNKSWLDHPYYLGGFVGTMSGSELVAKMIKQKSGGTGGIMFGYNFNDYWGFESRLHFASIDIYDTAYAKQLVAGIYPEVTILPTSRTNQLTVLDVSALYYPLGNAKWRPYFKYGLGFGQQEFIDTFGFKQSKGIGTMPMGIGMRYWWNERLAIQMDLTDNIIFATGNAKTQNNFAFTLGLTYAFGTGITKQPVHYWPATPSMGSKW